LAKWENPTQCGGEELDFVTGLNVTIYGLGIVFLALLVLMFAIMVLSRLFAVATGKDFMAAPTGPEETAEEMSPSPVEAAAPLAEPVAALSSSAPVLDTVNHGAGRAEPAPLRAAAPTAMPATPSSPRPSSAGGSRVTAPLPGKILSIAVKAGDAVRKGDELCVIEAMKMGNSIKAQRDCVVQEVMVAPGDTVPFGAALLRIA
jgi:biotin carboxyl carrier protein